MLLWTFSRCHSVYPPGGISSFLGWRPAQALPADQGWCLWCTYHTLSIQLFIIVTFNGSFLEWKVKLELFPKSFLYWLSLWATQYSKRCFSNTNLIGMGTSYDNLSLISLWLQAFAVWSLYKSCKLVLSWRACSELCELPGTCVFPWGLSLQPISYSKLFWRSLKLPKYTPRCCCIARFGKYELL